MAARWYFAWIDEFTTAAAFDPPVHARQDEIVVGAEISQKEGEFARARIDIKNPGAGLLNPDRLQFAFISTDLSPDTSQTYITTEGGEILAAGDDWLESESSGAATGSTQLVFWGRVTGAPRDIAENVVQIELIAQPPGWEQDQADFVDSLKIRPHWDPLFISERGQDDPAEVLAGRSELLYWDRATGDVSTSDVLEGSATIDLGVTFDHSSLRISPLSAPPARVDVRAEVEWRQRGVGMLDVASEIESQFAQEEGTINTLSADQLERQWPGSGQGLGDSGYTVQRSKLTRKPLDDEFPQHPPFSNPVCVSTSVAPSVDPTMDPSLPDDKGSRLVRFPRAWYSAILDVRAVYEQQRKEEIRSTVEASTQPFVNEGGGTERINVRLQNPLEDPTPAWQPQTQYDLGDEVSFAGAIYEATIDHTSSGSFFVDRGDVQNGTANAGRLRFVRRTNAALAEEQPSFFLTARGQDAVTHALIRARARIRKAARAVRIRVSGVPLDGTTIDLTTDHNARIADDRIPGGEATGKVADYAIEIERGTGQMSLSVTIECAIGFGGINTGEAGAPAVNDYTNQLPFTPVDASDMDELQLIDEITVRNSGGAQSDAIVSQSNPRQFIDNNPTSISIDFKSLRAEGTLEHTIGVETTEPVYTPQHIDLESA